MAMPEPERAPLPNDRSAETTVAGVSWLAFARQRERFRPRWPSVFSLRLVRDHYDLLRRPGLLPKSLLDVGATDRVHEGKARARFPGIDYKSLDIDRTNTHDYHDFREVQRSFDVVTLFEVLEHVPQKEAVDLVRQCFSVCAPGGWLVVSVPNVQTPGVQTEWTHVMNVHYLDLAGLLAWTGFEVVDAARVYFGSARHRFTHAFLLHPLHRLMAVDYAQSVVMLARRPATS